LPQLRDLRIEAEVSPPPDDEFMFDDDIYLDLVGLPPGLETLEV